MILTASPPTGGTALTIDLADGMGRPVLVIDPNNPDAAAQVLSWLEDNDVRVLNLAGPRESGRPGIYAAARGFLLKLLC